MNPFDLFLIVVGLFAVANLPVLIHLLNQRKRSMPLDFTKLNAAVSEIAADATALQAQAAASNDTTNQAAIDAAAAALGNAHTALQTLLPTPAAETEAPAEPAAGIEQAQ